MEDFSKIIESAQLPLEVPIRPSLKDHRFSGHAVLPAVEAMEMLAQAVKRFRPGTDVTSMTGLQFEKFLYIEPGMEHLSACCDVSVFANGDIKAVLTTNARSKTGAMARIKSHAALTFPGQEPRMPTLALDLACSLEGICFSVRNEKIYPDLISFGPFYRNVCSLLVAPQGVIAEIRTPVEEGGAGSPNRLEVKPLIGSPFALDAAFHAACVWGQRFAGIVAFPVAVDRRRIYAPTRPGETYFAHVIPTRTDAGLLVFDLRIYDRDGGLCEACSGVGMRDVSGGKMRPPHWIECTEGAPNASRVAAACKALAVIELASLMPFADKTLSEEERKRFETLGERRRKSYLAARLACKRVSRKLSDNDTQTDPRGITTVSADRQRPCCPWTDGRIDYSCSVSHDDRFAVAVASEGRVGIDVEKMSERLLKSPSLYMSEQEQTLVRQSRLGEIEAAVRVWSIKEAVAKAIDLTLADAWQRVRVETADLLESNWMVDDQHARTAVHHTVGQHVFTLVQLDPA